MPNYSVTEAARELGVSPRRVRKMVADGDLRGERVGHEWSIDPRACDDSTRRRGVGRPWSPLSAWAVLALAGGGDLADLGPVERSRARRRLEEHGLVGLQEKLRARAKVQRFYGHPAVLDHLLGHPAVVRSGVSAASDYGADITARNEFEGYVRANDVERLADHFALHPDSARPNIVLRVVDDEAWPFPVGLPAAPQAVVALDLLDAPDERSRRAGNELAEKIGR